MVYPLQLPVNMVRFGRCIDSAIWSHSLYIHWEIRKGFHVQLDQHVAAVATATSQCPLCKVHTLSLQGTLLRHDPTFILVLLAYVCM